jgi:multidrug efflux pump subunit AcrB
MIRKVNPADTPILVLGITSDTLPLRVVDAYAQNILLQKISQISGVGLVGIGGEQQPAVRVQVDPDALAARGINLEDVRTVLGQANVDLAKGTLNSPRQTYTLNTNDQLFKSEQYADLIVAYRNGAPVRVRDIGRAIGKGENELIGAWFNKKRAILLAIQRQPGANVIETVGRIKAMLPVLQASIPPAVKISIISDRTQTIRASVADVLQDRRPSGGVSAVGRYLRHRLDRRAARTAAAASGEAARAPRQPTAMNAHRPRDRGLARGTDGFAAGRRAAGFLSSRTVKTAPRAWR